MQVLAPFEQVCAEQLNFKHNLPIAPDLLERNFTAQQPDQVWTTYITTDGGWLCLTVLLDLYSRQVVGWSMKEHMQASP